MSFSAQQNFVAEIDGTTAMELAKKLNYKINDLEGRKNLVGEILDNTEFFNEYFSEFFKASLTTRDGLSSEVNVCKVLESMANYLLNSKEVKQQEDAERSQYVFYTDPHHFNKKMNKELSIEALEGSKETGGENLIHFLKTENKNYKKPKTQKITSKDLSRDDFLGEVLRSYSQFSDFLTEELKKGKESKFNRYTLSKIKGQVDNDMIYSKDHLLGIWGYEKRPSNEASCFNVDVFDFTNVEHLHGVTLNVDGRNEFVKGLLYFMPTKDYENDFNLILIDLENLINKTNLTHDEMLILKAIQSGLPKKVVAELLSINPMKVTRTMISIAEKISSMGNKYDKKEVAI